MEATIDLDRIYDAITADEPDASPVCDAIGDHLAVRDAAITLISDPTLTRKQFRLLAERPRTPEARLLTEEVTTRVLQHPETADTARITRIARLIGAEAERRREPQPHAMSAYLHWLTGNDTEAAGHALTALVINEDTSLAALVITAIQQGIHR